MKRLKRGMLQKRWTNNKYERIKLRRGNKKNKGGIKLLRHIQRLDDEGNNWYMACRSGVLHPALDGHSLLGVRKMAKMCVGADLCLKLKKFFRKKP